VSHFASLFGARNKLLPLKRSDQMCLQNVGEITHRSKHLGLYTQVSKLWRLGGLNLSQRQEKDLQLQENFSQ
jgi:hypothetical protein